jgi:hypothetical protein
MSRRSTPLQFVNIHGQPLGKAGDVSRTVKQEVETRRDEQAAAALSPADLEQVFDALVLAGWQRGKTALMNLLRGLDWRREDGRSFGHVETGAALRRLLALGRVRTHEGEGWSVPEVLAEARLGVLLAQPRSRGAWRVLLWVAGGAYGPIALERDPAYYSPRDEDESVAVLRLVLADGIELKAYRVLVNYALSQINTTDVVLRTLAQLQRVGLFERVDAALRWQLLASLSLYGLLSQQPALQDWVESHIDQAPADATGLRLHVAEMRLQRGDGDGMQRAVAGDAAASAFLPLMQSLLPARQGRFTDTAQSFPPAWKALCAHLGKKRGFAPPALLQWYPLALMAQHDAAAWSTARKFCIAQSGSRTPSPFDRWGRFAHVLAVRLGDARLEIDALAVDRHAQHELLDADAYADRVILAAWLGRSPPGWDAALVATLVQRLHQAGLSWKADLVAQACAKLGWPPPARPDSAPPLWDVAFYALRQDAWRDALAAITALGEGAAAIVAKPAATLRWRLTLDDAGRVHDLHAFEPPATARGKPKALTPLQLKKRSQLDPRDAAVARSLRQDRYRPSSVGFDLTQAAAALVGHPALELGDAPGVAVELVESLPVLEVRRERRDDGREHFVFRLHDELLADDDPDIEFHPPFDYDQFDAETERRNSLRIVRDGPSSARLVRMTPGAAAAWPNWSARAGQVPVAARAELESALRVLGTTSSCTATPRPASEVPASAAAARS